MKVFLDQIKFANAVKLGRNEDLLFRSQQDFRGHGTDIELVAVKMAVENAPGEYITQPLVKLTDPLTNESTYTSLANAIYFKAKDLGSTRTFETKAKRAKATI